ncbi:MAG: tripartite tricarboxylate transporter substrate binding protein, partial [Alphaproteobacteria bacterium]|nr:tripartite tricarboxylate transporter substrate binding protein [Alphaproteobacteria bacterium]
MRHGFAIAAVLLALGAVPAASQEWPAKPVKIIAPFAPGGTADTLGRLVAIKLTDALGQQFVVENRPGAGGLIGSEMVARAVPDGYTLVVSGVASHVVAPALNPNLGFDPIKDFTHIALFGGPPDVLVVSNPTPARTLAEFIAYGKTSPGKLSYATPGIGTHGHLVAELLQQRAGFRMEHVPYRGAGQAVGDIVGNQIPSGSFTLTTASEHIRAGTIRALAVSSPKRLPDYPDVPTYTELGFPELVTVTWFSLSGPAGIPEPIVKKLNAEVIKALALPDIRQRLARDAIDPEPLDPAAFVKFIEEETKIWVPIARASGA